MSPSASVPAAERSALPAAAPLRIGLAIGDAALLEALRARLPFHPGLIESPEEDAAVIIADAPLVQADFESRRPVLLIGTQRREHPNETVVESLDPAFVLAAATLIASGYRIVRDHAPPEPVHLSSREKQVLALLVEGASNKLIARRLDISVHTAKFHVTAVLEKLGAQNRSDAVAIALREGLVML
ncbi:helix-turn-helix transcriptional regulator [Devosia nitrariae]|uniref:Helix-turn-helix transcriptional regulator n=1 Tax=Devosia nitrariae TaxID=2071872 RepID=A0ABQ5W1H6_9HYPH|nr:LuxR C-terminal-related transcriptional regulator [Devosia nitrariae]GLQ53900.1 helix-turn-helix transcriptional regulator [Devosia nitrariae]